jgi:hypothetical protein
MNSDNKYMNDKHKEILERLWEKNSKPYQYQYPDMFDPKWTIMESGWPWLKLSSLNNQPFGEMLKEAEALIDDFKPHREDYGHGWRSLTLHGLNEDTQSLGQYSEDRNQVLSQLDWTWVADKCPVTKKFLEEVWPAEFLNRVRFMLVEPGGYILPHRDRPDDQKRLSVCNISLNNPEGCEFVMGGFGKVPFDNNGSAFLMDISNFHSVWNRSDRPRIHMIIHYEIGRRLRDFFYELRTSYYTNRENNA